MRINLNLCVALNGDAFTTFEEGITRTFLRNKHSIEVGFDRGLYRISKVFEGE